MLIGVVGLCLGFLASAVLLLGALRFVLQRSVDAETTRTATDVAALVDAGALARPLPVAGSDRVQVIDAAMRVRAASIDADRLVPMLGPDELARARDGQRLYIDGDRLGLRGPVRVVAVPAGPPGDPQTVVVARSMADALKGVAILGIALLVMLPPLIVVLAWVAWRTIGATLRPVEALRRTAEEITGTGATARLPVPAGSDEIHRLAVTLNGMLDRLEGARARQRQFVGDAAHELRTPLANMIAQLEVAQRLGERAEWPAVAEDLLEDTRRMSRLVDDLLLLARADEAAPARFEPVDLATLLDEVGAAYPTVTYHRPGNPVWTMGEREGLRRVVANLLENAVRHAESTVTLGAVAEGDHVVVTVVDDGPGIPAADRDRVFERFTRLDDGRARDDGGAGLGLAIVRQLVRRHGGTVELADAKPSEKPPGLRVRVLLPAQRS
ncbi:MAG TPA: ATP-binding protein [Micromonosporaceae bacterium]|nr:ATP-binding protein [Micromonosporaceae bacterium]